MVDEILDLIFSLIVWCDEMCHKETECKTTYKRIRMLRNTKCSKLWNCTIISCKSYSSEIHSQTQNQQIKMGLPHESIRPLLTFLERTWKYGAHILLPGTLRKGSSITVSTNAIKNVDSMTQKPIDHHWRDWIRRPLSSFKRPRHARQEWEVA